MLAANNSTISTFGAIDFCVDLGFRQCRWTFYLASVSQPILGADFLSFYNLAVDLRGRRLIDLDSCKQASLRLSRSQPLLLHTVEQQGFASILTEEFPDVLTPTFNVCTPKHRIQHHITTTGPPTYAKPRRLHGDKLTAAKREFKFLADNGVVRRSNSPYSSPLHMVPKADGTYRPCGDFKRLNASTVADKYPLPHIQDFSAQLRGCTVFSKVDLVKGFYNIPVAPEDIHKTAVITPFGLFEFLRMPFGLCNAAQTFQRFMDSILHDMEGIFVYMDDILVATPDEGSHRHLLRKLFRRLREHGLAVNPAKCQFGKATLQFLGHEVASTGISPLPDRVKAVREFPQPQSKQSLMEFLGLLNYYHRFIPRAAHLLYPLNAALRKDAGPFTWTDAMQSAFVTAKNALADATMLVHPKADAPLGIASDASDKAIGASLEQLVDGQWEPLGFFSATLHAAETRYSTFDRELLAIYLAVKHFRHMVEGRQVAVYTDHKPLTHAMTSATDYSPRQTRHLARIAEFTTDIRHISGKDNAAADALSRNALPISAVTPVPDIDFHQLAAAQLEHPETQACRTAITGLRWSDEVLDNGATLLCDISTGRPRPYVPPAWRKRVFEALHSLSHPGAKGSRKLITSRFVWHQMNKDITAWAKTCLQCQKSKVHRHVSSPRQAFDPPGRRFEHIHVDIVGPLPASAGFTYLFTAVDRFTRWADAVPMRDATAASCAQALLQHWVARFGVPLHMTSDRGRQFISNLWTQLGKLLGCRLWQTTAYHPQSNGMVERFHRQLKAALMARLTSSTWTEELPLVLLAIRATPKDDLGCAPAELVYGSTIRLPGEFFGPASDPHMDNQQEFLPRLRATMRQLRAAPPLKHGVVPHHMPASLQSAEYVFIRHDAHRSPLQQPYDGPFKVVQRNQKYFIVDLGNRTDSVSVDRLKPAFVDPPPPPANPQVQLDHSYASTNMNPHVQSDHNYATNVMYYYY